MQESHMLYSNQLNALLLLYPITPTFRQRGTNIKYQGRVSIYHHEIYSLPNHCGALYRSPTWGHNPIQVCPEPFRTKEIDNHKEKRNSEPTVVIGF